MSEEGKDKTRLGQAKPGTAPGYPWCIKRTLVVRRINKVLFEFLTDPLFPSAHRYYLFNH